MAETLKEKTVRGLLWGAFNTGGLQVLNIVFGIVIARQLDPGDYGLIGMVTIFTTIASALQESGFTTALINRKNPSQRDLNSVFWFSITVSFSVYVILWMCAPLIAEYNKQPAITSLARYLFLGFLIGSFGVVPRAMLLKEIKAKEQAVSNILAVIVSGIVGMVMAFNGMAYWGIATQTILYILVSTVMYWYYTKFRPTTDASLQPIKEMFVFSSKMLATRVFVNLNRYMFESLLGYCYDEKSIGYYSQANRWNTQGSNVVTNMMQDIAQPMFVKIGDDEERLRRAFRKMLRFTCFLSFPMMFGLSLIAPEFISVALTDKYAPSASLMQILCVSGAFLPIATLYYNLLLSRGKSDIYMWNVIAQSCFILADLAVVQYFHLELFGCSGIRLMTIFFTAIMILWTAVWHYFLKREIHLGYLPVLKDIMPFLLITVATMVATYYLTSGIADQRVLMCVKVVVAAALYLGITYFSGAKIMRECINYFMHKKTD
ncbi:MAG: lipopolysaccharide biosynthesis protein [Prevotellaceae bacterium]|nr:lipopolysaccharide biosynthesis protein [Candidatus Colivivens caballi]